MNLLEKFLASTPEVSARQTVYGKVIAFSGIPDAIVDGTPKRRVLLTLEIGGTIRNAGLFADSVSGLPSFIPAGGLNAQITLRASDDERYPVNVVAVGIEGK